MTAQNFKIAPLSPLYKFSPPHLTKIAPREAIRPTLGNPELNQPFVGKDRKIDTAKLLTAQHLRHCHIVVKFSTIELFIT